MKCCPLCNRPFPGQRKPRRAHVPDRQEYERFRLYRMQDMGWGEIGRRIGLSYAATYKRAKRLEAVFGKLPGRVHEDRNPARDYIRLKELRDAGLPWRMACEGIGVNEQYARQYFYKLSKVYGG